MKKMMILFFLILFGVSAIFVGAQTKPLLEEINFLVSGNTVTETGNGDVTVELKFDCTMNETISPTVKFGFDESFFLILLMSGSGWFLGNIWQGFFTVSNLNSSIDDGEYIFQVFGAESAAGFKMDTTVSADASINKNLFICRGGQLQLTTTVLDFSIITLGSSQSMNVIINNQSCSELTVSSITVPLPFRLVNPIGSFPLIPGNGSRLITVEFNPTQRTSYSINMTIFSDDRFQTSHTV